MQILKKLHQRLEQWCSHQTGRYLIVRQNNRRSPSGLQWALYETPWYYKLICNLEYQLRYLIYPKPECIKGFFPFYRRK